MSPMATLETSEVEVDEEEVSISEVSDGVLEPLRKCESLAGPVDEVVLVSLSRAATHKLLFGDLTLQAVLTGLAIHWPNPLER